jgi:RHS repeat-associated protein
VSVSGPGGSASNNNYANTSMVPPVQLTAPTFGMALTTAACPLSTYTLTAATVANATQYTWSSSTGVSFSATSGQTVTCSVPAGSHSITLTVYGGPGYCPNSVTNPLNQAPVLPAHAPTGTAASATQVNQGTTINLTVGNSPPAGATLEWTHQLELSPGVLGQATSSGSSPTVTGAEGSRHHYTPYFANSCGRVAGPPVVVTITCPASVAAPVITQPVANAQGQIAPVLPLTSISLSASNPAGLGVVRWTGPGGWTAEGSSASYPVALNQGGQVLAFTARVELPGCNLSSSPVSVSVPVIDCPQHTPTITGPASVPCPTASVQLTAGQAPAGYAYAWSTGATTQAITLPINSDEESVSLTFWRIADGCPTARAYHTVSVLPDPSMAAPVLAMTTNCATPAVSQHLITVQTPNPAYTYYWRASNGQEGSVPDNNSYQFAVTNGTQNDVSVTVYARRANGCRSTSTSLTLVPCLLDTRFSVVAEVEHNTCGETQPKGRISLRVLNAGTRTFTFGWDFIPGTLASSSTTTTHVRENVASRGYKVTVTPSQGTAQTLTINVGRDAELTAGAGGWRHSPYRSENRDDWTSLMPKAVPNPEATSQEYAFGFAATPEPSGTLPSGLLYGLWVVNNRVKAIINGAEACERSLKPDQRLMILRDAASNQVKFFVGDSIFCTAPTNPSTTTPLYLAARTIRGQLPAVGTSFCVPRDRREVCAEPGLNYVRTWTPYLREKDLAKVLGLDTKTQASVQTTYFDGLGRPIQAIGHYASPGGNDVVQPQAYDAFGREPRQYLPYTVAPTGCSQYRPLALKDGTYANSEQFKFYQAATGPAGVVRDANPYADTHFEASPLDRPLRQGAPGAAWQVAGTWQPGTAPAANDRTVKHWGRPNLAADKVRRVQLLNAVPDNLAAAKFYSPGGNPNLAGAYAPGQLWATITIDEHQRQVQEFKDKGGRTVLKRVETGEATPWADTYYVYDDFDRLVGVVPPQAAARLATAPEANQVDLDILPEAGGTGLGFATVYDAKGRPIHQYTPGKGWTHTVYDRRDRPVLAQDPLARNPGGSRINEWAYTRYDALDRPVATGWLVPANLATGRAGLQATLDGGLPLFEERIATSEHYYTNQTLPPGSQTAHTVAYYDHHDLDLDGTPEFAPQDNGLLVQNELFADHRRHRGRPTVAKALVLESFSDGTTWTTTATHYDRFGRPVQTDHRNFTGGADVSTTRYDFVGRPRRTRLEHRRAQATGSQAKFVTIDRDTELDHAGRPTRVYQQVGTHLGAQPRVLTTGLELNELGQLWRKRHHSTDGGQNWLQEVTHRYHVRGWLAAVNDQPLNNGQRVDAAHLFRFSLDYEAGPTAQYNGNIAAQTWQSWLARDGVAAAAGATRRYAYTYDAMNRLTAATYSATGGLPGENYTTDNLQYDLNGNLKSLRRYGALALDATTGLPTGYGPIDQLAYDYNSQDGLASNQLRRVTDAVGISNAPGRADFQPRRAHWSPLGGRDYSYDANGTLNYDPEKNLTAQQNCLNLPYQVVLSTVGPDGQNRHGQLDHRYSATGQKLWRQAREQSLGGRQSWTEYHGPLVYEWDNTPISGGDPNDPKGGGGGGIGGGGGGVVTFTPGPDNAPALPAFAGTEEGRVVGGLPNLPFGHPDTYEYHYRDHLGNLRLAYRPRTPQGQNLRLTNEPENAAAEADNQRFSNFVPWRSAAHAHAGLHGLRATVASGRTGRVAERVRLVAGQALAASAMALYEGTGGGSAQQRAAVAGRAADGGTAPPPSEVVGSGKTAAPALEMQKNGLTLANRIPDPSVPRARLVLRLFAEASGGTVLHEQEDYLDNTASWAWQQLSIGKLATVDCWAEVYVENLAGVPVWFDDLEIQTGALPVAVVVQETHYDPWGLELAGIGYVADPTKEHKWTYNGKEKQDQFGLGWLDYGARHYQPDIARWGGVDPLAGKYVSLSPFCYTLNNPIRFVDHDGKDPEQAGGGDPPKVRVYTETNGTGHAFISVGEGKNMVVYSYGQFNPGTNEGLLFRFTGEKAMGYVNHQLNEKDAKVFEIKGADGAKVAGFFDEQFNKGEQSENKDLAKDGDVKKIDNYSIFLDTGNDTCVDKTCDALDAGGEKEAGRELSHLQTSVAPTGNTTSRLTVPWSPKGLQDNLAKQAKGKDAKVMDVTMKTSAEVGGTKYVVIPGSSQK